jgi:hypothetical protein
MLLTLLAEKKRKPRQLVGKAADLDGELGAILALPRRHKHKPTFAHRCDLEHRAEVIPFRGYASRYAQPLKPVDHGGCSL